MGVSTKWVNVVPIKHTRKWDPTAPFASLTPEERELAYEMVEAQKQADLDRCLDDRRDKDPNLPPPACYGHLRPWKPIPHRTRFWFYLDDQLERRVLAGDYLVPRSGTRRRTTLYRAVCEVAAEAACARIAWLRRGNAEVSATPAGSSQTSRKRKASLNSIPAPTAKRARTENRHGGPRQCMCNAAAYPYGGSRTSCGKIDMDGPTAVPWHGVRLATSERQDTDRNIYIPFWHDDV
ncbi:hypothetical protein PENSPDRAFT_750278 [Peniophora sp. CONT]|nr:hypothetical protein PENSPDRAFT_750278 [Peniophora sp. CONT]